MRFPVSSKKERVDLMAIAYTEEKKFTKGRWRLCFCRWDGSLGSIPSGFSRR